MVIPDEAIWGGGATIAAIVGWFVTLERRLNNRLTRQEHEDICTHKHAEVMKKLDKLEILHERSTESRNVLLRQMELKIAVLETLLLRSDATKMVAERIKSITRESTEEG